VPLEDRANVARRSTSASYHPRLETAPPRLLPSRRTRSAAGHQVPVSDRSGTRSSPDQHRPRPIPTPPERPPGRRRRPETVQAAATPTRSAPLRTYVRSRLRVQCSAESGSRGSRRHRQSRRLACGRRPEGAVLGLAANPVLAVVATPRPRRRSCGPRWCRCTTRSCSTRRPRSPDGSRPTTVPRAGRKQSPAARPAGP
jgi:hypothetical protein